MGCDNIEAGLQVNWGPSTLNKTWRQEPSFHGQGEDKLIKQKHINHLCAKPTGSLALLDAGKLMSEIKKNELEI